MTIDPNLEAAIRRIVREELAELQPKPPRSARPCGRGNSIPKCMGSAARGPDHCTCPGVRIEYYPTRY